VDWASQPKRFSNAGQLRVWSGAENTVRSRRIWDHAAVWAAYGFVAVEEESTPSLALLRFRSGIERKGPRLALAVTIQLRRAKASEEVLKRVFGGESAV
jgi:hypothetical protein